MQNNNFIVLLVGASGSGKTTVAEKLKETYGWRSVQSYTDRPPRYEGETGHTFVSEREFDAIVDDAVAYTVFNKHRYCATNSQIENAEIYVVDPVGISFFHRLYKGDKEVITICLEVPANVRYRRMRKRGDSIRQAISRLMHDKKAFENVTARVHISGYGPVQKIAEDIKRSVDIKILLARMADDWRTE